MVVDYGIIDVNGNPIDAWTKLLIEDGKLRSLAETRKAEVEAEEKAKEALSNLVR